MSALRTVASRAAAVRYRWLALSDGGKVGLALLALALVYGGIVFGALPRDVFFLGDLGVKSALAASMARSDDPWQIAFEYPARDIDRELRFFPFVWVRMVGERPVPGYITVHMLSNALLYRLFGFYGLHLVPLLSTLVLAWLAYRLSAAMEVPQPWVAALLVGLCTPVFFYSLTTWEHAFAVCCVTLALYLMARQATAPRWWEAGLAGVVTGLGIWSRREMHLFPVVLALSYLYVFRSRRNRWRSLVPYAAAYAIMLALLLWKQHTVYNSAAIGVVALRAASVRAVTQAEGARLDALRALLINQAGLVLQHTVDGSTFWGERIFLALAFVATILAYRLPSLRRRPLWVVSSTLSLAAGVALAFLHSRLSMVVGLIPTLPLAALGVVYPPAAAEEGSEPRRLTFDLVMTANVGLMVLGLLLVTHAPGYCWGPRFLAALFPLMGILAWRTFRALELGSQGRSRLGLRMSFAVLVLLSLVVQCVGVAQLYEHNRVIRRLYDATRALDAQFVISDTRHYLEEMGGLYFDKTLLRAEEQEDYDALIALLYEHGVRRYAWVANQDKVQPLIGTAEWTVQQVDEAVYELVPTR